MEKSDVIHILKLCRWEYDFDVPQYFHLAMRKKSVGWYDTLTQEFDFTSNRHQEIFAGVYDDVLRKIFEEYFGMDFFEYLF